jgi:hypothetical protein
MTVFFFFFPCFSCPPLQKFSATLQVFFSLTRLGPWCFNFYYFIWINLINWFFFDFILHHFFSFHILSYFFLLLFFLWFLELIFVLQFYPSSLYLYVKLCFYFLLLFFNPDKFLKLFFFITSLNLKLNLLIGSGSRI